MQGTVSQSPRARVGRIATGAVAVSAIAFGYLVLGLASDRALGGGPVATAHAAMPATGVDLIDNSRECVLEEGIVTSCIFL